MSTLPAATPEKKPVNRILPPNPLQALIVIGSFTVLLYLIELVDTAMSGRLDEFGIQPRTLGGLDGIIWAPLLHSGWSHLLANTVPVLVFGFLAMATGIGPWIAVTATIWIFSGLGVWLTGTATTIGASGIAFGWLAFLLVRGIFNGSFWQIVVAGVLFVYWGSTLLGVLPGNPGVSWQGHLFGAIGGILAAWLVSLANRANRTTRSASSTPVSAD